MAMLNNQRVHIYIYVSLRHGSLLLSQGFLIRWTTLDPSALLRYWAPEPMCESATTWRLVEPLVDSGYSVTI